jgi:hypothetical protein
MKPSGIYVGDGDTIDALGKRIRLVGFDAPELGELAHCGLERMLAARATSRLRQMIQLSSDIRADRRLLMSARYCWDDGLQLRTVLRLSHYRRPGRRRRAHRGELGRGQVTRRKTANPSISVWTSKDTLESISGKNWRRGSSLRLALFLR